MTNKKVTISTIAAVALIAIAACVYILFGGNANNIGTQYVYIDNDDNIDSVLNKINAATHPAALFGFKILAEVTGYSKNVRSGRYEIPPDISMFQLFRDFRHGHQKPVRLVMPSVRTLDALAGSLSKQLMLDSATLSTAFKDTLLCQQLGGYTPATLTAMFIPNTYELYWNISVEHLLSKMKREYELFWNAERTQKAQNIRLSRIEVATLASIVDSETAYSPEKPIIAGLYLNRLHKNMLLQSDPTVIYAMGDFTIRRVLHEHLQIKSPYNTYLNHGLPPAPIRIATIDGIDAVLNARRHDFLYMCAKEDFSGSHNFAVTYAQHTANARRYAQALNRRNIMR